MKRVLSMQDLSCIGRCSLSVTLPVLSAMGCRCDVLPTAVLSTHTAFPQPFVHSLTGDIEPICDHWKSVGVEFDAVSIGYLSDPAQVAAAEQLLEKFPCLCILDPAMGDHGKLYHGIWETHPDALRQLCRKADILLPNVTEAALLTGIPYRDTADKAYLEELLQGLLSLGVKAICITGIEKGDQVGYYGIANEEIFSSFSQKQTPSHGTGDLFSAVFTGAVMQGKSIPRSAALAAAFVERTLQQTANRTPFGVEFEAQLPYLWQLLQK